MTKIFIFAVSLLTASVVYAGEGLQPYILFGDSGQTIEETNKQLSAALTQGGFEVLGQYAPAESPDRSVIAVSHPELLKALSALRASCWIFFCNQNWCHCRQWTNLDLFAESGILGQCLSAG